MGNRCVGARGPQKQENMHPGVGHGNGNGRGRGHGHAGGRSEVRVSATAPEESSSQGSVGVEAMSPKMPAPSLHSAERGAPEAVTVGGAQEEEPAIAVSTSTSANMRETYTIGRIEAKETPSVDTPLPSNVVAAVCTDASAGGKIEVCTGGKCRKGGSQQILASLQESIPGSSNISVTSSKCLKNCKAAPNLRVTNCEGKTQLHSHVSMEDIGTLLGLHFGNQGNAVSNLFASIDSGVVVAA